MTNPILFVIVIFASPFVGSFLGLLADRWPRGENVVLGRSRCNSCRRALSPYDLIPIASTPLLRAKCRYCGANFGWTSFWCEVIALLIACIAVFLLPVTVVIPSLILGWTLLLMAALDAEHFWLPDRLTLGLATIGIAWTVYSDPASLPAHLIAGSAAYLALAGLAVLYKKLRGRDGLGLGDAKLMMAAGFWLGPAWLGPVLLIASSTALSILLLRRLYGHNVAADTAVPLGTYLAPAIFVIWVLKNGATLPVY